MVDRLGEYCIVRIVETGFDEVYSVFAVLVLVLTQEDLSLYVLYIILRVQQ